MDWFTFDYGAGGSADRFFAHDPIWSTLIGYPASYGADTELNDHHFHYGYFIMAASVIARFDDEWAGHDAWGGMINLLIKDAANWDRDDERFCFLRHMEPYVGYSYASGHAGFAAGNNQESSSEAMNFAAAVVSWGAETGQHEIRDLGLFLMSMETQAIERYWFDVDQEIFPEPMPHPVAGIVWDSGADYATWWTGNPEEIQASTSCPSPQARSIWGNEPIPSNAAGITCSKETAVNRRYGRMYCGRIWHWRTSDGAATVRFEYRLLAGSRRLESSNLPLALGTGGSGTG